MPSLCHHRRAAPAGVLSLTDPSYPAKYGFSPQHFNLESVFGTSNYHVLSSPKIIFTETEIQSENGISYAPNESKSLEYGPAIWNPAATCNFSSRSGTAISAITIHTIQGSYAGAISWAQNCASSVSYHYVIRSSDGQVTQMVLEADKAWHVGSENPYTIGYEHEGYVDDPSWYTEEMYNSSADLSRDIVNSGYGLPPLRTYYGAASASPQLLGGCTKIKGHQHYPNATHTDPGVNWDWEKYYRLINNMPVYSVLTNPNVSLYDTGGITGDYQDDEREFWLIQPNGATDITINFTAFDLEQGYDNLFIYDGDSLNDPLIGSYTGTNSPGQVTSTGGSLLIEFRSDCGTISSGWEATYTSTIDDTDLAENELDGLSIYPNPASSVLSISHAPIGGEIIIYDGNGRVCLSQIIKGNSVDISLLETGFYNVAIRVNESLVIKKLVVL